MLSNLEEVALMVRMHFLPLDAVYMLLEGPLKSIDEVFGGFARAVQLDSADRRELEHAVWLLTKVQDHSPTALLLD